MTYDYCVISYPKCGRTWLRMMVSTYCKTVDIKEPRGLYTHLNRGIGGTGEDSRIQYLAENVDIPRILLKRDPIDTLVSYYHDDMVRGKISKMVDVRGDINGYCRKYLSDVQSFYEDASKYYFSCEVRYEDLIEDTVHSLMPFLEVILPTRELPLCIDGLKHTVEECSFDTLHKLERDGAVDMKVQPAHQKRGFYKTRKGKVGSAIEELDAETYDWMRKQL